MAEAKLTFVSIFYCVILQSIQSDIINIPVTNTVPINCSDEEYISLINVTLDQPTTKCHHKSCNLTAIEEDIKTSCDGTISCVLSTNLSDDCLREFGFVDFSYSCEKSVIDCDFETSCSWVTYPDQNYRWVANSGETPTDGTGPTSDHTTGSDSGLYLYLEASDIPRRSKADFTSVLLNISTKSCFSFWYHMYGDGMGSLDVYIENDAQSDRVWHKSRDQGDEWLQSWIDLLPQNNIRITLQGTRGRNKGDIAVDDIHLTSGSCFDFEGHLQTCSSVTDPLRPEMCASIFVDVAYSEITYYPEVDGCLDIYQQLQESYSTQCQYSENVYCEIQFSHLLQLYSKCFILNTLSVEYICNIVTSTNLVESTSSYSPETEDKLDFMIGVSIGAVALVVCVIVFIVYKIRYRKQKQNNLLTDRNSMMNNYSYELNGTLRTDLNNLSSTSQTRVIQDHSYANIAMTAIRPECIVYANDPKVNTDTKTQKKTTLTNKTKQLQLESRYEVLDPTETGYDRSGIQSEYELASSISRNELNDDEDTSDQYVLSDDGTYDTSTNVRHVEADDVNVYNQTVDNVYNTAGYGRKLYQDDTYDHFTA